MTIHRKKRNTLSAVATTRWSAYAAAGAASAFACASSAEAVIHVVEVNEPFAGRSNSFGTYNGTFKTFPLGRGSARFDVYRGGFRGASEGFGVITKGTAADVGFNGFRDGVYNADNDVSMLAAGANIATLPFIHGKSSTDGAFADGVLVVEHAEGYSQWKGKGQGYVGIEFNEGAGEQYGWVSITLDSGADFHTFTLNSYAYGDPGDLVTAGEVPEPGSLALLAVGGAGLLAWRKRRALAAAKPALPI